MNRKNLVIATEEEPINDAFGSYGQHDPTYFNSPEERKYQGANIFQQNSVGSHQKQKSEMGPMRIYDDIEVEQQPVETTSARFKPARQQNSRGPNQN